MAVFNIPASCFTPDPGNVLVDANSQLLFCQYIVLKTVQNNPVLRRDLILRGSSCLQLVYGHPRVGKDMDFMHVPSTTNDALAKVYGPLVDEIGRAIEEEMPRQMLHASRPQTSKNSLVQLDITANFYPCDPIRCTLPDGSQEELMVTPIDLIVGQKLYSLATSPFRKQYRHKDVFDVAMALKLNPASLNASKIRNYFYLTLATAQTIPRDWPKRFNEIRHYATPSEEQLTIYGVSRAEFDIYWDQTLDFYRACKILP